MAEYGVTSAGFVLKRFDAIYSGLAAKVKEYAGIDITAKSDSVLNLAIFFPVADAIAQLHEESLDVYNSLHPSTAEGVALNDACQFANVKRKAAEKTVYQISCNMTDGNTMLADTIIAADTNPRHDLYCDADTVVSRDAWNEAYIKLVTAAAGSYQVSIDGEPYIYTSATTDPDTILSGLAAAITVPGIVVSVEGGILRLISDDASDVHALGLTDNLTTESITGLVQFSTGEYGSIVMPDKTITTIISNKSTGFNWCENRIAPDEGRLEAEDYELRQDYIAQIYSNSSNMVESIQSYLLQNVDDIVSVNVYENVGDETDSEGRLPHSIEVVAEGGTDSAVAYAILACRPGGIQTNGTVEVACTGSNDDVVTIRFNRPTEVYAWLKVSLEGDETSMPSNYKRLILDLLTEAYGSLTAGETLYNQLEISDIYSKVPGLTRVVVMQYSSTDSAASPAIGDYTDANITVQKREKIVVEESRIEVVLNE